MLNSGVMPDIWLVGNIKSIYKNKGNPLDPKNFRPISFFFFLFKISKNENNVKILSVVE
jgi:hypothetical protein